MATPQRPAEAGRVQPFEFIPEIGLVHAVRDHPALHLRSLYECFRGALHMTGGKKCSRAKIRFRLSNGQITRPPDHPILFTSSLSPGTVSARSTSGGFGQKTWA